MRNDNRAIFLDRDNTIVDLDKSDIVGGHIHLIRGAAHALGSLRQLGYHIIVVTNEDHVANGEMTEDEVDAMHQRIAQLVHESSGSIIDRFYYCPFHPQASEREYRREHPWRKPKPGMIKQATTDLKLDLDESWVIGDDVADIEAGLAAGCHTVLICRDGVKEGERESSNAHFEVETLAEAAAAIAQNRNRIKQKHAPIVVTRADAAREATEAQADRHARSHHHDDAFATATETVHVKALRPAEIQSKSNVVTEQADEARHEPADSSSDVEASSAPTPNGAPPASSTADESTSVNRQDHRPATDEADTAARSEASTIIQPEQDGSEISEGRLAVTEQTPPATSSWEPPQRVDSPPVRGSAGLPDSQTLLTELLGEFRSWRTSTLEFTPLRMYAVIAMVVLLFAAVLAAIYLEGDAAVSWIGVTLVAQVTIIGCFTIAPRE